jgi:hypothetical protein
MRWCLIFVEAWLSYWTSPTQFGLSDATFEVHCQPLALVGGHDRGNLLRVGDVPMTVAWADPPLAW